MASTEKLKSGRYRGVYRDAAMVKRYTPTQDRKRDALADAREAEVNAKRTASASKGTLPGHTTWEEWLEVWWPTRDIEPSTEKKERYAVANHLLPGWGDWELARITQPDVQDWVTSLHRRADNPLSGSTTRRVYTIFRSSISAAVRKGVLTGTPCVDITLPPKSKGGVERLFDEHELAAIHAHLGPAYRFAVDFIIETGLRPGEFAGLHWSRIDRRNGWLTVRDTYDKTAKRIKTYPKDAEERSVPLTSKALELLTEYEARYPTTRSTCGLPHQAGKCKSDLVFRQPRSKGPMDTLNFRFNFVKAQRAAEVTPVGRPYDLRHAFGTRLAEAGVDPWEIARLMGHATLEQSGDYIHRTKAARMRVLAALGDPTTTGLKAVEGDAADTERGGDAVAELKPTRPTTVPRTGS
ncbi:tyrosine-type recombinase/integrase [Amycolatopsis palatopharyngis]|uniref:tyrosine-type recombinase/integrase n=1 Tax=Amycolatopsis palatopharyngis TaxID=187982 RepID=UPI000E22F189|nr:site-specific integrase [Amycolatopsis palatopharyngis]